MGSHFSQFDQETILNLFRFVCSRQFFEVSRGQLWIAYPRDMYNTEIDVLARLQITSKKTNALATFLLDTCSFMVVGYRRQLEWIKRQLSSKSCEFTNVRTLAIYCWTGKFSVAECLDCFPEVTTLISLHVAVPFSKRTYPKVKTLAIHATNFERTRSIEHLKRAFPSLECCLVRDSWNKKLHLEFGPSTQVHHWYKQNELIYETRNSTKILVSRLSNRYDVFELAKQCLNKVVVFCDSATATASKEFDSDIASKFLEHCRVDKKVCKDFFVLLLYTWSYSAFFPYIRVFHTQHTGIVKNIKKLCPQFWSALSLVADSFDPFTATWFNADCAESWLEFIRSLELPRWIDSKDAVSELKDALETANRLCSTSDQCEVFQFATVVSMRSPGLSSKFWKPVFEEFVQRCLTPEDESSPVSCAQVLAGVLVGLNKRCEKGVDLLDRVCFKAGAPGLFFSIVETLMNYPCKTTMASFILTARCATSALVEVQQLTPFKGKVYNKQAVINSWKLQMTDEKWPMAENRCRTLIAWLSGFRSVITGLMESQ